MLKVDSSGSPSDFLATNSEAISNHRLAITFENKRTPLLKVEKERDLFYPFFLPSSQIETIGISTDTVSGKDLYTTINPMTVIYCYRSDIDSILNTLLDTYLSRAKSSTTPSTGSSVPVQDQNLEETQALLPASEGAEGSTKGN